MNLEPLNNSRKCFPWLLLFSAVLLAGASFLRGLPSGDETRVGGICMEMLMRGDYVVPYLNGEYFLEYPAFYYQCGALAMKLFGVSEWSVRLPSLLGGIICVMSVAGMVKKLGYPDAAACLSGGILLTSIPFFDNIQSCMVDPVLAAAVAAGYFFYAASEGAAGWKRTGFLAGFTAALTLGVMTKGLLAAALISAGVALYLVWNDIAGRKFSIMRYVELMLCNLAALALTGIWVWALWNRTSGDRDALYEIVIVNNFGRFLGSQGDHNENIWYYFIKLPAVFLPYWPVLLFAFLPGIREKKLRLPVCWLLGGFFLLLAASSKRQIYLLPLYGAASALCGVWLYEALCRRCKRRHGGEEADCRTSKADLKYLIAGALVLLAVYWGISAGIAVRENSRRLEGLFADAGTAGAVYLYKAPERTRGAAFFYRRAVTPEIKEEEELVCLPEGCALVGRGNVPEYLAGKTAEYPDRHWLYKAEKRSGK